MLSLLIASAVIVGSNDVGVETLDGRKFEGTILDWSQESIRIKTETGEETIDPEQLLVVRPHQTDSAPPSGTKAGGTKAWVELIDGSILTGSRYRVSKGQASLTLVDGKIIEISRKSIASVRFQDQDEKIASQWDKIRQLDTTGDLLVVRKKSSIDFLDGVIEDVDAERVGFRLDDELNRLRRDKIHGLVYFHATAPSLSDLTCVVDANDQKLFAHRVRVADGIVHVQCQSGVEITHPLSAVRQFDYSADKIIFLSDLTPDRVDWKPQIDIPNLSAAAVQLNSPRSDISLTGDTLQLDGMAYRKGIALRSRTALTYRLPGKFNTFSAIAGIDDAVRPRGHARLTIHADNRLLWDETLSGQDEAIPIELNIAGAKRIQIVVDFGEDLDIGDHVDLCDAKVIQ